MVAYARDEYVRAVEVFKRLDDKAAAVANYLGAGTGVVTFGSLAGVAADRVPPVVILFAVPSVLAAMASLCYAVAGRRVVNRPSMPMVDHAVAFVSAYPPKADAAAGGCSEAEARFLAEWHDAVVGLYRVVSRKGDKVDQALRWFRNAVLLLLLPLGVGIFDRLLVTTPPPEPPRVNVVLRTPTAVTSPAFVPTPTPAQTESP